VAATGVDNCFFAGQLGFALGADWVWGILLGIGRFFCAVENIVS